MAMQSSPEMIRELPSGQRLQCEKCGSEIEIIQPCGCNPPQQILRCCGEDMKPTIGKDVHLHDD